MPERQTIQVPPDTHSRLRDIADQRHETMADTIARLIALYDQERFWNEFAEQSNALRNDPVGWAEYQSEQRLWDTALKDGLEDE